MTAHRADWRLVDLSHEPGLVEPVDQLIGTNLPPFMTWESPGNWRWNQLYDRFPSYQLGAVGTGGRLLGAANGVPLRWHGDPVDLPGGYDEVLTAVMDHDAGRDATVTCLLSVSVDQEHRGAGLATELLAAAGRRAAGRGHTGLVIPLRPTLKQHYPLISIERYARWQDPAGAPFDPWLRTHVRAGASVLGFAPRSLVIRQPAARWEQLTGRPMPGPGHYLVSGALVPVECDATGWATYTEPNIWVLHRAPVQREGLPDGTVDD